MWHRHRHHHHHHHRCCRRCCCRRHHYQCVYTMLCTLVIRMQAYTHTVRCVFSVHDRLIETKNTASKSFLTIILSKNIAHAPSASQIHMYKNTISSAPRIKLYRCLSIFGSKFIYVFDLCARVCWSVSICGEHPRAEKNNNCHYCGHKENNKKNATRTKKKQFVTERTQNKTNPNKP